MHTRLTSIRFAIIVALLSLTTITVISIWFTTQPAVAKIYNARGNNRYLAEEEIVETSSQEDEFSSNLMLVSYEEEQQCRKGDVLSGVHDPGRLNILSSCEEVIGIVDHSERAHDGDYKLYLDVEDDYKYLLNEQNDKRANGLLVVEVIPKDQESSSIQIPEDGDRIKIVGAWVTDDPDRYPGWNEIHPAWKVVVLE
jgi:hypothetical protein